MKFFVAIAIVTLAIVESSLAQDQSIGIVRDNGVCVASGPGGTTTGPCGPIPAPNCPGQQAIPQYGPDGCISYYKCVDCGICCCWCENGTTYKATTLSNGCPCCTCVGDPRIPIAQCACEQATRANLTLSVATDSTGANIWSTTCQCSAKLTGDLPNGVSWN